MWIGVEVVTFLRASDCTATMSEMFTHLPTGPSTSIRSEGSLSLSWSLPHIPARQEGETSGISVELTGHGHGARMVGWTGDGTREEEGIKSRIYERAISETDKFSERAKKKGAARRRDLLRLPGRPYAL